MELWETKHVAWKVPKNGKQTQDNQKLLLTNYHVIIYTFSLRSYECTYTTSKSLISSQKEWRQILIFRILKNLLKNKKKTSIILQPSTILHSHVFIPRELEFLITILGELRILPNISFLLFNYSWPQTTQGWGTQTPHAIDNVCITFNSTKLSY